MTGEHHLETAKIGVREHKHDVPIRKRRKKTGNQKPMRFGSLHHHTTFSYKDGFLLPEAHIRRAIELQMPFIAFTEHGNVSSHVKAERAARKLEWGGKLMFGCEVYTGRIGERANQMKYHLTLIAKDQVGYANLLALVSKSYSEGFYYEPTVSFRMLQEHKKGLVVLSGCQGSLLFCSAVGGKLIKEEDASYKRALDVARRFKAAFGSNYFIEVQAFPELDKTRRFNAMAPRLARAIGSQLAATMDCHYVELEDAEMQQILHNIRGGGKVSLEEQVRDWGYEVPLCPPPNDRSIYRRLRATGLSKSQAIEAIVTTEEIAAECTVELPKLDMVRFPLPRGYRDAKQFWREKLREGWFARGCDKLEPKKRKRYRDQLAHEMKIIEDKDFVDYMMIVTDGIRFMKDQDIPVWVRGSAAASICCWLLGISDLNPMDYPMFVFERFIDVTREDLPDVDADFPSEARPMLRDYLVGKYGERCVSNLGTFTYFKPKLALDDTARVFHVPKFKVERVKDYLIERSSGDLRASSGIEDTIEQFEVPREIFNEHPELYKSFDLEGNIKGHGVHAAGLVISNDDVRKVSSVMLRELPKNSGNWVEVLGIDKYDAEYLGMIKMDFLGLRTMSMLHECLSDLGMKVSDLADIPKDDPKVLKAFQDNDVVGIFQFDGRACRYVNGAVKPETFEEVCDITALGRPGALHNGAAREYAEIKHGHRLMPKMHPAVAYILEPTKGQIVYQEQILRIVTDVGGFPHTKAAEIRRIIAKKHGEQAFNRRKQAFLDGAKTVHKRFDVPRMAVAEASELWGHMITAGSYGFNAPHAYMYGWLGYILQWIKQYEPQSFYARGLKHLPEKKEHDLLRDAAKHRIRVLPPSPSLSDRTWAPITLKRKMGRPPRPAVRAGFEQIEGIAEKTSLLVVDYREKVGLDDWDELIHIRGIGVKTIEKIKEWIDQDDPFGAFALDKNIKEVKRWLGSIENTTGLPQPTHRAHDLPYESGPEFEVCWLGTVLDRNIRDIFEQNRAKKGVELKPEEVRDPHLNEWAMLTCEDETDQLLIRIDRWKYPRFKQAIFDMKMKHDLLLVEGVRPHYVSSRQINVKKLYVISP